jgi:Uma2 family endonuclease
MSAALRPMTADELLALPSDGFHRYELVKGRLLVREPAGFYHGRVASMINYLLSAQVVPRRLGVLVTADPGFHIEHGPDTVRSPDVAFVRADRVPAESPLGFYVGAPDLAVEVLSPGNWRKDLREKIPQWLDAGTRLVWVVDTQKRTVTVHAPGAEPVLLRAGDVLTGGDVVPGFSHDVAECFA